MARIYYWSRVMGDAIKFEPYQAHIQRLLGGEYKSLSLEKLKSNASYSLYTIRVNDATRILFTTYQRAICLLDVILNHDHDKSAFLKDKTVLNVFLQGLDAASPELGSAAGTSFEQEYDNLPEDGEPTPLVPLKYYQHQLIKLGLSQESALDTTLPAIVYGPAGSGKTYVALTMLLNHVQTPLSEENPLPIVYVTQSSRLKDESMRLWQEICLNEQDLSKVVFQTYDELLRGQVDASILFADDKTVFQAWYESRIKSALHKIQYAKQRTPSHDEIWFEFRIRSGYSEEEYKSPDRVGKQTLDPADKALICDFYLAYEAHLRSLNTISPILYSAPPLLNYQLLLVDEAQDFSYGPLNNLHQMSENIVFFLGDHQVLFDGTSRLPFLQGMFFKKHTPVSVVQLPVSYRSAPAVIRVANMLITLKYNLCGLDKADVSTITVSADNPSMNPGTALWFNQRDEDALTAFKAQAKSVHFAIVTLPAYIEDAKHRFNTGLVFTVEEIKGLEYDTVMCWRILDQDIAIESSRQLSTKMSSIEELLPAKSNRSKDASSDHSFLTFFNEFITAVTRAKQTIIISHNPSSRAWFINAALKESCSSTISLDKTPTADVSMAVDWEAEVKKLLDKGLNTQAHDIFIKNLGRTEAEYETFLRKPLETPPMIKPQLPVTLDIVSARIPPIKKIEACPKISHQILCLLNDFSAQRLTVCFNVFNFEVFWLQTTVEHKVAEKPQPLIAYLLQSIDKIRIFTDFLIKEPTQITKVPWNKLLDLFTAAHLCDEAMMRLSGLIFLGYRDGLINDVEVHWERYTPFFDQLTDGIKNPNMDRMETCFLYWLSKMPYGKKFLLESVDRNIPHMNDIFMQLSSPCTKEPRDELNKSPLFWLSEGTDGIKVLMIALKKNPDFISNISEIAWIRSPTNSPVNKPYMCPLSLLLETAEGQNFLEASLFKKAYLKAIPPSQWCNIFHCLLQSYLQDVKALNKIETNSFLFYLEHHPKLYNKLKLLLIADSKSNLGRVIDLKPIEGLKNYPALLTSLTNLGQHFRMDPDPPLEVHHERSPALFFTATTPQVTVTTAEPCDAVSAGQETVIEQSNAFSHDH